MMCETERLYKQGKQKGLQVNWNVLMTGPAARARGRCRQVAAAARMRTLEARSARYLMHLSDIAQLRAAAANLMMASSLRMTCMNVHRESKSEIDQIQDARLHARTYLSA